MESFVPPQLSTHGSHYDVLGVSFNATEEEIKKAYHAKARQFHPDKTLNPSSEEAMKRINEAKSILTDRIKRNKYDEEEVNDHDLKICPEFALPSGIVVLSTCMYSKFSVSTVFFVIWVHL